MTCPRLGATSSWLSRRTSTSGWPTGPCFPLIRRQYGLRRWPRQVSFCVGRFVMTWEENPVYLHLLLYFLSHEQVVARSGSVLKFVHCENCHAEYVYRMQRMGTGRSSFLFGSKNQAQSEAEKRLWSKLENDFDV